MEIEITPKTRRLVKCSVCASESPEIFACDPKREPTQGMGLCASIVQHRGQRYVTAGYGSMFDSCEPGYWMVEEKHKDEIKVQTKVCDECIEKWICEQKIYCGHASKVCLLCKTQYKTYNEFCERIRIDDEDKIYYITDGIRKMTDDDFKYYQSSLSDPKLSMWICRPCYQEIDSETKTYPYISKPSRYFKKMCKMCDKQFELSTLRSYNGYVGCNTHIVLSADPISHVAFRDHVTIGEAKKYTTSIYEYACDECVEKLIAQNILYRIKSEDQGTNE
jgi:hypothetical protein